MLSNQGRKAVFSLCSKLNEDYFNCETLLSLFDTYAEADLEGACAPLKFAKHILYNVN
jgi:hypothetical protein